MINSMGFYAKYDFDMMAGYREECIEKRMNLSLIMSNICQRNLVSNFAGRAAMVYELFD